MKNVKVIFVLMVSSSIFTADVSKGYDWQEHFKAKIRSEMTPEEKEAYEKQQRHLKIFHERKDQPLPRKVLVQSDEKKGEDIEAALHDKGFKTDFSQEEEKEYEQEQLRLERIQKQEREDQLEQNQRNKKLSQDQGFDFLEDQTEVILDPNNIETWTPENVRLVQLEFFKKLKTADIKKLIKNKDLVEKLSLEQVQAIDEKELSAIIQRHVKNLFSSKNHQAMIFPDEFVEKLSGDQINRILEDHVGGFNGMGKNFSSYFSPKMRNILDQRQAEYKNYGGNVADLMQKARLQIPDIEKYVRKLELPFQDQIRILKIVKPNDYQEPFIEIDRNNNLPVQGKNFLSKLETLRPQDVFLMNVDQIKDFLTIKKSSLKDRANYDYVQNFDPASFASAISSNIVGISDNKFITESRLPEEIIDRLTFDQVAAIMQKTGGHYQRINPKIISIKDFYKLKEKYFTGDLLDTYLIYTKKYGQAVAKAMIGQEASYRNVLSNDQKKILVS